MITFTGHVKSLLEALWCTQDLLTKYLITINSNLIFLRNFVFFVDYAVMQNLKEKHATILCKSFVTVKNLSQSVPHKVLITMPLTLNFIPYFYQFLHN